MSEAEFDRYEDQAAMKLAHFEKASRKSSATEAWTGQPKGRAKYSNSTAADAVIGG